MSARSVAPPPVQATWGWPLRVQAQLYFPRTSQSLIGLEVVFKYDVVAFHCNTSCLQGNVDLLLEDMKSVALGLLPSLELLSTRGHGADELDQRVERL